jgi:ABC-type transporter Mla subunit MlaD
MGLEHLLRGFLSIWRQDRIAFYATGVIVLFQAYILIRVWRRTWTPLGKGREVLEELAERIKNAPERAVDLAKEKGGIRLARAVADALSTPLKSGVRAGMPPELALERNRLLPDRYNGRLDAAAPGLFTALGIVGTFVGLVFGFLRVEPTNAMQSVAPLMGGMVVAFFNSLIGVVLSVVWAYNSRVRRHLFDVSCSALVDAVAQRRESVPVFEDQLLTGVTGLLGGVTGLHDAVTQLRTETRNDLKVLSESIDELKSATDKSSQELLGQLSTQLGNSLQALVSTPFNQLNESVLTFDRIVRHTAEQQVAIQVRMDSAAHQMADAQERLAGAVVEAKQFVEQVSLAAAELRVNTEAASGVVEKATEAGSALAAVSQDIRATAEQYAGVTRDLADALGGVTVMTESLKATAEGFSASTTQLEAAVTTLRAASDETVEASVHAVQHELQRTMASVLDGLRDVGTQTIAAYETSSERVSHAVDNKMSDLTDRLSAELTTLASRLPSEVEGLNQSMNQIRIQITKATRSMEDAVQQLAHRTPEALKTQLDAYDSALAKAMDRFSGTLLQWDEKVSVIEAFATQMQKASLDERRLGTAVPTAVVAS